jgi:hypothetical protein
MNWNTAPAAGVCSMAGTGTVLQHALTCVIYQAMNSFIGMAA